MHSDTANLKNKSNIFNKLKSTNIFENILISKDAEIVDLLNKYRKSNKLSAELLGRGGAWLDAGSISDFYNTSNFVSALENRQGLKIACLEEIALNNKWIKRQDVKKSIEFYGNCDYSKYLKSLIN